MNPKKVFYYLQITCLCFLLSCGGIINKKTFEHNQELNFERGIFNTQTIVFANDAYSGKKYSRADVGNNYGIGYSYLIPDSLRPKNLAVKVDAWVRTGDISNNCDIIVSLTSNDSILAWLNCDAKDIIKNANEWTEVNRTLLLPRNLTSKNNVVINVMAQNVDAKSFFDVDDLKIKYFEVDSLRPNLN